MLKQVAAAAFFAALVVAQDFIINTPSGVTVCQPTLLTWTGGQPPYFLDILDGDNLNGGSIENLLTSVSNTSYTWVVNLDAGLKAVAQIRDNTGLTKTTAPFPINAGTSKSCIDGSSSSSSSSGSSSSAASTSSGSSASSSKPVSSSSSHASSSTSTTAAPATSSTPASTTASTTPASTTPASSSPAASSTTPTTSATTPATSPSSTATGAALAQTVPVAGVLAALAAVFFA